MHTVYRLPQLFFILLVLLSNSVFAHEIRPAIITLQVQETGQYKLEISANLEALSLGIGGKYKNTDDSPKAAEYTRLRALSTEALETTLREDMAALTAHFDLRFGDQKVSPVLDDVNINANDDLDRARLGSLIFKGQVPVGEQTVRWSWSEDLGANVFRVRLTTDQQGTTQWLKDGKQSDVIDLNVSHPLSRMAVFVDYLQLGFSHIVPLGIDHILFVLGLFLLSTRWRPLLAQVTAFTVAHTITLGMSIYGLIALSPSIVEPLIAASIVFVAVENVLSAKLRPSRVVLVFMFGLLHGMGFAGVLRELGLPESEFVTALISFNVGVELGQLAVIASAYLLVAYWFKDKSWYRKGVVVPGSLAIGVVGAYWTVERVFY